jgi:hypothetical protein
MRAPEVSMSVRVKSGRMGMEVLGLWVGKFAIGSRGVPDPVRREAVLPV